jgi:hypothetical protein
MKRILAIGIILLFIGMSISSSTGYGDSINYSDKNKQLREQNFGGNNDTTPPYTTYSINGTIHNGIYNTPIYVTLNATDNESGVNVTYYDAPGSGGIQEYIKPFRIEMPAATFNFAYYSIDNAGNKEEWRYSPMLHMDLVPPEVREFRCEDIVGPMEMELIALCIDELGSGCDCVEFYDDGKLVFTDYDEPYEWIWKANTTGKHTLRAIVYDKAGNAGYNKTDISPPFPGTDIFGLIRNPKISGKNVSFFAIIVCGEFKPFGAIGFLILSHLKFSYYKGHMGKHFVNAEFWGMD